MNIAAKNIESRKVGIGGSLRLSVLGRAYEFPAFLGHY